ncbi:MAG: ABC transporter permease [Spirochaetes bacterium]|nr:ABC transporter permease [Spirochaetota bacterium]MBP8991263.1 ABC transporter permease [Spirochaetota bacterium]HOV46036.1 ABC transporter permease [Exilispira sp.]HQQ19785.1 ABC transporter permease [Exilispira sp.]
MKLIIEKNRYISNKKKLLIYLSSLILGIFISSFIFLFKGINPFYAIYKIFSGSFFSLFGLKETITKMIPLLLIGSGLTVAFQGKFWNIGAEGQLLAGATVASWIALNIGPKVDLVIPLMFLGGFIGGALWAMIAAYLKSKLGINDIISTLMLNYIMAQIVQYLIYGPWKGKTQYGFPYTDNFPANAILPLIKNSRIHWITLILGLIAAVLLYFFIYRTKYGYEIRVVGENPNAAKYAGINFIKVSFIIMIISGGLAGLAGVGEVAAIHRHLSYPDQISANLGYTGIIVAWLALLNPLMAILTSFFFGGILVGGDIIQTSFKLPFATINLFNGLILVFALIGMFFIEYKIRIDKE